VRLGGGADRRADAANPTLSGHTGPRPWTSRLGGKLYFALAMECRLSLGLRSFPRPIVQARSPPNSDIGDLDSLVHPGDRKELAWPRATGE
jgi:hypothetical protein